MRKNVIIGIGIVLVVSLLLSEIEAARQRRQRNGRGATRRGGVRAELGKDQEWDQSCFSDTCNPNNIHLAILSNSSISVTWMTLGLSNTSTVRYGTHSGSYSNSVTGSASSTQHSDSDGYVFFNNIVILNNLSPSTLYYYTCGDPSAGWSKEFSFVSPPSGYEETSILVYGDLGISKGQETVTRLMEETSKDTYDFVFHVGDMSYADDYNAAAYQEVWNGWFRLMEPIMTVKPYMVAPGNHEYKCHHKSCDKVTKNFTEFRARFRMPYKESGAVNNMWYSFDYSNIHFIVVDTETDYPLAPEGESMFGDQLGWLEEDLKKANQNRAQRPWIIVGGHRPIYSSSVNFCSNTTGQPIGDCLNLQKAMEKLFYKNSVDLFLVGHVHAYERTYPTYQSEVTSKSYDNPKAPVYVTAGAAGCTEGLSNTDASSWVTPAPSWSAFRLGTQYGYGSLVISYDGDSETHSAKWSFWGSSSNTLLDSFTITKSNLK